MMIKMIMSVLTCSCDNADDSDDGVAVVAYDGDDDNDDETFIHHGRRYLTSYKTTCNMLVTVTLCNFNSITLLGSN